MGTETKIRWTDHTWGPVTGCVQISSGCDHCYAKTIAEKYRGTPAFPVGFDPMARPWKLDEPKKWKEPSMIFVNSMSDLFLASAPWDRDYLDSIFDVMLETPRHIYQVLTKRPKRMRDYLIGPDAGRGPGQGYLARRGLFGLPEYIWPGVTIENDSFAWRADVLREIPAPVRMISAEPLLTPLPSLKLKGLGWIIVGGESGPGFRPMDHEWARDLRDRCAAAGVPFYFKQSSAYRTEMGKDLDGQRYEAYPQLERDKAKSR